MGHSNQLKIIIRAQLLWITVGFFGFHLTKKTKRMGTYTFTVPFKLCPSPWTNMWIIFKNTFVHQTLDYYSLTLLIISLGSVTLCSAIRKTSKISGKNKKKTKTINFYLRRRVILYLFFHGINGLGMNDKKSHNFHHWICSLLEDSLSITFNFISLKFINFLYTVGCGGFLFSYHFFFLSLCPLNLIKSKLIAWYSVGHCTLIGPLMVIGVTKQIDPSVRPKLIHPGI